MQKQRIKPGPKPFSPYTQEIENLIKETYSQLSELDKRAYVAIETLKLARGGKTYIANLLGCSRNTIIRGIGELKEPETKPKNRLRKKGGGRKSAIETIDNIDEVFLKVIDDYIAGDPMNGKIRWTNLSHKKIAKRMQGEGIKISVTVIKKLLKRHGFTKRKALKKQAIGSSKNRNEQFENIARLKEQYLIEGNPVISMDTKKKNF
jgi:predicted transcriptional regulator